MLEKSIEDYLVAQVEAAGGIALKGDIKGRRFIDRICIMPGGVTAYAECKRGKSARVRALQDETIKRLRLRGHIACFVYDKFDVDHFMAMATATGRV